MRLCWGLISGLSVAVLLWAVQAFVRAAPLDISGALPQPAALGALAGDAAIANADDWKTRRAPLLRRVFSEAVYGPMPAPTQAQIVRRGLLDAAAYGGLARIEALTLRIPSEQGDIAFSAVLALPIGRSLAPLVIAPNFCGDRAAFGGAYASIPAPAWTPKRCRTDLGRDVTRVLHGANIIRPPIEMLLRHGYAVLTFFPFEIVPDDSKRAPAALSRLPGADLNKFGAVAVWGWSFSRVIDAIEVDPRIDARRIALFGHSRFAKAALWAAALDDRIALVVANQSGRLGAAPNRPARGETLSELESAFPYWFPQARTASPQLQSEVDQHLLLALIAPRPILLGGARLDGWSDPAGAFRAAEAASPVYRLFGRQGLDQPDMTHTNLSADIAVFLREGGHGVRRRDWEIALAFMDAHFKRN